MNFKPPVRHVCNILGFEQVTVHINILLLPLGSESGKLRHIFVRQAQTESCCR